MRDNLGPFQSTERKKHVIGVYSFLIDNLKMMSMLLINAIFLFLEKKNYLIGYCLASCLLIVAYNASIFCRL